MTACICRKVNKLHLEDLRQMLRFIKESPPSDCELEAVCVETQRRVHRYQVHLDCKAEWTNEQRELAVFLLDHLCTLFHLDADDRAALATLPLVIQVELHAQVSRLVSSDWLQVVLPLKMCTNWLD